MANLNERAGSLAVLTAEGEEVPIASTWAEQPVVLVLIRHFGCIFCRQQVGELREIAPEIEAAGARLVVVGNGTPLMLEAFVEEFGAGLGAVYTDPSRRLYEALGARRGSWLFALHPRLWLNTLRAWLGGARQAGTQGDRAQLGGVWVVRAGGEVVFEHRSEVAGDHPSNRAILEALPAAVAT